MLTIFTTFADWITFSILNLTAGTNIAESVHFFIEDISKIFTLIVIMIYFISLLRASMNIDKVRNSLQGKSRWYGYTVASIFGAVTPFCSCSSIPLFLGFTAAGIPTGVTLSFLITSPLLNEIAIILLGSILGWKFTVIYLLIGLTIGIIGGFFFDLIGANKLLQPMAENLQGQNFKNITSSDNGSIKLSFKERHNFAKGEAKNIFLKIWLWVVIGIGIGSLLHGFIPENWITDNLGDGSWWSVPLAVIMGIPLYSNASGMIPVLETLLEKGLPVGTGLALMLSTVGASFPEFIMLKEVLKPKLLLYLFIFFLVSFTVIGWILNILF